MSIQLLRRRLPLLIYRFRQNCPPIRLQSEKPASSNPDKFTDTDAHLKWKARYNYEDEDPEPPSQSLVIKASLVAFMVYFFILREENDIDEIIYQPVWKTVPQLEVPLFEGAVIAHRKQGLPTAELEAHLKQALERQEKLKNQSGGVEK